MTIRIYLRCSTDDQSVKSQRYELEKWARGQDTAVEWYEDEGFSGLTLDRPAWKRLMGDLQPGDRLVTFAIDRIARDLLHFLSVVKELKARRVVFHSLREAVDVSTPFGEAMCEILAVFGKLETRIRQGRQRAGIEARRDPVTKKCPWGGRKAGCRVKVTEEREALIVRLRAEGQAVAAIARLTSLTRRTVYKVLARQGTGD
jgi:DNA invertase Pin-like site-specific DNA recombinase